LVLVGIGATVLAARSDTGEKDAPEAARTQRSVPATPGSGIDSRGATDVEVAFAGDRLTVRPSRVPADRPVSINLAASTRSQLCVVQPFAETASAEDTVAAVASPPGVSTAERRDPLRAGRYVVLCAQDGGRGRSGAAQIVVG